MNLKPTESTQKKRRREAEPDLVDRIFLILVEQHPELSDRFATMKAAIRREVGGERVYVRRREDVDRAVLAMFNGRNAAEVARTLGIGRTTVYRVLRQGFR